jgi:tetratricopeptide (TPR) repeat protein
MSDSAKFKAFLSYSRKDEDAVRHLHRRLESYEIPRALRVDGQARLGRFFRDKDELGAASELSAELHDKIAAAEWLIICCSPHSAASQWVNTEIEGFIATHGHNRVLAVILDGEPHDVFPAVLRDREPLAADFRKTGDGEDLGFLKLVAGLLGADLGELRDRQAAAERARTRNRAILAGVFGVLAVAASVSAVIAVQQRDRAEAMTLEAIDIGAGVLRETDDLSQRFRVPTSALEGLLSFADERFDRLFDRNVQSPELARQQAGIRAQFAELYLRTGDSARAHEEASAALAAFERFPEGNLRTLDYVRSLAALGRAEAAQGRDTEGIAYLERAVDAGRAMLADIPDGVLARTWLGGALQRLGQLHMRAERPETALPLFTEAVPLLQYVHDQAPDDTISATNLVAAIDWLGSAQALSGNRTEARATFTRSVALSREILARDPESLAARTTLGNSLMKYGQTLADDGDNAGARAPLEESVTIARALVASDANDAEFRNALALRLILTANVLTSLGQAPRGMMDEAITMGRTQVQSDPTNADSKETLARMLAVRAARRGTAGDNAGARADWREIVQLRRAIREAAPGTPPADLAYALEMIGDTSASLREIQPMLAAYNEAVPLRRAALAAAPQDASARASLAAVLHAQGLTKKFNNDNAGARAALSEAAQLRLALHNANRNDATLAFATVDSFQQLAVLQAEVDGAATTRSFEQARDILRRLVAVHPDNAAYADSLRRTEDVLQSLSGAAPTPAPAE